MEQCYELLSNINSKFASRDYCIVMLFLNCGMRLSELVGIDIKDIRDDTLRIIGKGNKERTVYLNAGCLKAIDDYLIDRNALVSPSVEPALFISATQKKRLTTRSVQLIIEKALKSAGLDGMGFSTHKLRHTAATLMYQHGNTDIMLIKEILGHENLGTTQIYTHVVNSQLKEAVDSNPLANIKPVDTKK